MDAQSVGGYITQACIRDSVGQGVPPLASSCPVPSLCARDSALFRHRWLRPVLPLAEFAHAADAEHCLLLVLMLAAVAAADGGTQETLGTVGESD